MNVNALLTARQQFDVTPPTRLAAGIALSLLVHMALLWSWRQGVRAPHLEERARPSSIVVWLHHHPTKPPVLPKAEPAKPSAAGTPRARSAAPKRRVAPDVIALPKRAPDDAEAPPAFTVEPHEPAAPHFDPEAARKLARRLANEPDPAKADTALARLPPKPLETETHAARAIAQAKRRDCKDGIPGGLLAPLYLMLDKKDSGCKW
jgi:hypothetical protein